MKKACLILLAAILLVSLFAGCAAKTSAAEQTATSGEETTVTMWTFLDPTKTTGREVVLAKLIDNYYAQTGVRVVVEPQAWDTLTAKFLAAQATGSAPDLIWVNSEDMGSILNANALEPLENLFVADWDQQTLEDAVFYISHADLLIIGGTSLAVYPAAGLIDYYRGNKLVLINKSTTPMDARADLLIQAGLGDVFGQIEV